jgi:hypothetical protein
MVERDLAELDLRAMMERALALNWADQPGRWLVESRLDSQPWIIVVEPDQYERKLVVITPYRPAEPE